MLMIDKISPHPSLPKRGREKVDMTHSITGRVIFYATVGFKKCDDCLGKQSHQK